MKERIWERIARQRYRFPCRCEKGNGVKENRICYFLIAAALICVVRYGVREYPECKEAHSGIPDAVSSFSMSNDHHLKVVANSSRIEDKEAFAREVIHMCQDNSFHSIRFSTDINGYPTELDITVYLNRKDVEKGKSVCEIEFLQMIFRKVTI